MGKEDEKIWEVADLRGQCLHWALDEVFTKALKLVTASEIIETARQFEKYLLEKIE